MKLKLRLDKFIFIFKNIDLLLHKLDMLNEETMSLNQRKLEALCGFYSHKDIPFFIQQVLTYLETPIQKKNLISKEILEKSSQKKEEANSSMSSVSFPVPSPTLVWNSNINTNDTNNTVNTNSSNNTFNTEDSNNNPSIHNSTLPSNQTFKFSFPPKTTTNMQNTGFPFNNGSNISNTLNQNSTTNFSFPTSNNTLNQLNSSSTSNFSQQQSTFTLPTQSIQNILKETSIDETSKKDNSEDNKNTVFTMINTFHEEHQEHPFIKIYCCPQDIINNEENEFLCQIAQHEQTKHYLFASSQLLHKQENKIYEYSLPNNYSWISTYNCLEATIFHIPLVHLFLTVNNENNHKKFENIHYLLCAFEDLLKNVLLPMLKHKELSKYVHPKIKEAITFPVAIAFDNEFKESQYSLKNLLINHKPKDLDIKWLKEGIQFNKDQLRTYQLLHEQELDTWIYSAEFKKSEYLYYAQFD